MKMRLAAFLPLLLLTSCAAIKGTPSETSKAVQPSA